MIFSILAFITLFISICVTDRRKSLQIQSANCLFEALYALTIKAYTGSMLGLVNFIRSCLFTNKEKFCKSLYIALLFIFEGIVIINCLLTWESFVFILPTFGAIIRTYCLWQSNMKYVRFSGMISGILFGTYYIFHQS